MENLDSGFVSLKGTKDTQRAVDEMNTKEFSEKQFYVCYAIKKWNKRGNSSARLSIRSRLKSLDNRILTFTSKILMTTLMRSISRKHFLQSICKHDRGQPQQQAWVCRSMLPRSHLCSLMNNINMASKLLYTALTRHKAAHQAHFSEQ